jgi:hypothetical protein
MVSFFSFFYANTARGGHSNNLLLSLCEIILEVGLFVGQSQTSLVEQKKGEGEHFENWSTKLLKQKGLNLSPKKSTETI